MRSRLTVAWTAAAVTATLVAGVAPASAAWESDYGSRTTVTFGDNVHTQMPVTLDLPAPASGGAVTSVVAKWSEVVPQRTVEQGDTVTVSASLDASACTADATCRVTGVLPTARMANGTPTVTFAVSNSEGLVDFFSRTVAVQNPKPTVTFTAPGNHEALWGDVTLSADAVPSTESGAAPLRGVRFYVDGSLAPDAAYRFDDTAPYSLTLPATDIAPVLGSRYLVAVAEDADGNLSQMPVSGATTSVRRLVTVGPPPDVTWTSPQTDGAIDGSLTRGVSLEFHAALPDSAPARPGEPSDPYIHGYQVWLDGVSQGTSTYDEPTVWNGLQAGRKLRAIDGWWRLSRDHGLTAGRHTVKIRVSTSYGSSAVLKSAVLVADGVTWTGPVTAAGRRVRDGFWVTAGTLHRFKVPVATTVAGSRLDWVDAQIGGTDVFLKGWPCASVDPATCPESTVVRADEWAAPNKPGKRTLTFTAQASGDDAETLTRTLRIQPAARLSLDVSTHRLRPGRRVRLTGRLTRRDTGAPQTGFTVYLQWRRPASTHWKKVATRTTDADGVVRLRQRPTADGYYRLRSPQVLGTLGAGTSTEERVDLR